MNDALQLKQVHDFLDTKKDLIQKLLTTMHLLAWLGLMIISENYVIPLVEVFFNVSVSQIIVLFAVQIWLLAVLVWVVKINDTQERREALSRYHEWLLDKDVPTLKLIVKSPEINSDSHHQCLLHLNAKRPGWSLV